MNLKIVKLAPDDHDRFIELVKIFKTVFELENPTFPPKEHLRELLKREDFLVFVALEADRVVGGVTAYVLMQYHTVSSQVFIYDVAVQTEYQRKGIGGRLISEVSGYCREKNHEEMFLFAEEIDDHAIEFYRSTGALEERVVGFSYPLRED